jgi:hypothetical protein
MSKFLYAALFHNEPILRPRSPTILVSKGLILDIRGHRRAKEEEEEKEKEESV